MAVLSALDLTDLPLTDAHCHQVTVASLSARAFARWCTESQHDAATAPDSQVSRALRRWCAPVLGLPAHADLDTYLAARHALGVDQANRRLMRAARLSRLLVDTGVAAAGMAAPDQLADVAGAPVDVVVRLEAIAESVVDGVDAAGFAGAVRAALDDAYAAGAVAAKSIAAYRHGLNLSPRRPGEAEVRAAAGTWMRARAEHRTRLTDPVLLRHLLWCAVDLGRPIQLHTGFGDPDASLIGADPSWLQPFCAATQDRGAALVLLHCYPYHRAAGWLAHLYPHVYVDVGLSVGYLGTRATAVLGEFLELAPFDKVMYSSDAYGIAELYQVGAAQFRHSLGRVLGDFVADDAMPVGDAYAIARAIGSGTASRLYRR